MTFSDMNVTVNGSIRCNSIRVYRDHQFAKLFRMKYIVGYLLVDLQDILKNEAKISRG